MLHIQQNLNSIDAASSQSLSTAASGNELETMVAGSLVTDLNEQLAGISSHMQMQLEEKRAIRGELAAIDALKINTPSQNIDGVNYVDLGAQQALLLGVTGQATPLTSENGEVTSYRLTEADFQTATKNGAELRKSRLDSLNEDSELTMIQVQSLVDQRKNALTLLSNLLAASNDIAKTIIGNVRG